MTRASTVAFTPRNPLARILAGADRQSFADHVAGAEQAVKAIAPSLIESLDGDVRGLIRLCRQDEDAIFGQCREIGWLALKIVEAARLAGRPGLADVAKGVWEMVDALSDRGVWHTDALRLHGDAMGALMADAAGVSDEEAIARELARMREAIGAQPPS